MTTGLVVVTDLHGVRPLFDQHVARLREEGFFAVATEPWWARSMRGAFSVLPFESPR